MDEVDDLVVTPFKEIVDKAKTAVENAGHGNPVMLKAAQSLLKEGERGVKRIEPLCRKHVDDYGYNFIAFLKDNDEIAHYRSDLTDILWEFDDYVEPDGFDADKFTELQALSRKAAPRICDLLRRAKLEAPVSDAASSRGSVAQLPTPTSPPTHPGVLLSAPPGFQRGSADSSGASLADIHDATSQLRGMMRSPSAPEGHPREPPPKAPTLNPWDWQKPVPPPVGEARTTEEVESDRRVAQDESPVLPAATTFISDPDTSTKVAFPHPPAGPPPPASVTSAPSEHGDEDRRPSATSQHATSDRGTHIAHHYYHTPSRQRQGTLSSFSIPENEVSQQHGAIPYFQPATTTTQTAYPPPQHSRQISNPRSAEPDSPDLASLASYDPRGAHHAGSISVASTGSLSPLQQPAAPPRPPPPQQNLPVKPAVDAASASVLAQMDAGPIPVEVEEASKPARPAPNQAACRIGDDSSFHLAKGFCEGAKDVTRGGIGVKRTKKQGFSSQAAIARCLGCLFELDFAEIEADVKREDKGNHSKVMGINYRIRFLQKSHLAANRVDDVQYACVFCIQQGYTVDKSDATVFFNQKSLFDHLARHPRPLPHVPGFTVIEGDKVPEKHHNDYDIHFRAPPVPHPVIKRAREIASQPTGVAKEQARRLYGQRLLYDRSPALELAKGARLTGITWPVQYQGEWTFAWHDGNFASVPSELVKLDPPPSTMVRYDRTSMVCARAKWKFAVKEKKGEKSEWLKFDKNDTITNIAWVDADCWCWTGTNSKGKSGIFPQAFLDANTVQEPSATSSKRAASLSGERARSSSMLSKLSSKRKNSGRPPSVSNSVGSH